MARYYCLTGFILTTEMLGIQIIPINSSKMKLSGEQEPLVGGYIGTLDKPVVAEGPIFVNGGLYHFTVPVGYCGL